MKETRYIIFLLLAVTSIIISSCDKKDCNGDLDGMWQLTLWTSPAGDTVATKENMIFYSVQLQMMKFQKTSYPEFSMMSSFENFGSSIRIYDPIVYKGGGHDSIYSMDTLGCIGVPLDGIMKIDSLTGDRLVLSSISEGRLHFRKY